MQQQLTNKSGVSTENVDQATEIKCTIPHDVIDYEEKVETRHLKHWVIKASVLFLMFASGSIVLTLCYASITNQTALEENIVKTIIHAVVDIIKFMSS